MTITSVVEKFMAYKPRTEKAALIDCRLPLRYLSSGCFRNVYAIEGTPLVVKFPILRAKKRHSAIEIRVIERLKEEKFAQQYEEMKPYLPKFYYTDKQSGVTVMRRYRVLTNGSSNKEKCNEIGAEIGAIMGIDDWDYHTDNFGRDSRGRIVLLDLGCLEGYPCG